MVNGKVQNATATWKLTRWAARMTVALLRGGLALRMTSLMWGEVWREAEYEADRFAAAIGWGKELAEFLEGEPLERDHPIPLVGLSAPTHPPMELRIDALRKLTQTQPPGARGSEARGGGADRLRSAAKQGGLGSGGFVGVGEADWSCRATPGALAKRLTTR